VFSCCISSEKQKKQHAKVINEKKCDILLQFSTSKQQETRAMMLLDQSIANIIAAVLTNTAGGWLEEEASY
jgi:riboflavin synthase